MQNHLLKEKTYFLIIIIVCMILFSLFSPDVQAQSGSGKSGGAGGGGYFKSFSSKSEASRWTLHEWLEQKNKIYLMDMWLSMHAPSPYEFSLLIGSKNDTFSQSQLDLNANSSSTTILSENKFNSYVGRFQAYAQFIGISVEHENNSQEKFSDLSGLFHIRLLGNSIQNSNLTLAIGQRTRQIYSLVGSIDPNNVVNPSTANSPGMGQIAVSGNSWVQTFGQVSLSLHVTKQFGFDGKYRVYQTYKDTVAGDITGQLTMAGAFIDFYSVRLFGQWYKENTDYKNSPTNSTLEYQDIHTGIQSGLEFFF